MAAVVGAKDEAAAAFCARYQFLLSTQDGRRMFLLIAEVARIFA